MASSTVVSPFRLTTRQLVCYRRSAGFRRSCSYLDFRFRAPKLVTCTSSSTSNTSAANTKAESQESVVESSTSQDEPRTEGADVEAELESQGETETEGTNAETEGGEESLDEESLALERGPSVDEAKQMAKYLGQVDAFAAPYRTKRWALTRNKGAQIADLMIMYGGLLDRGFGSGQIMAASGAVVIEKIKKDANKLLGEEDVKEQDVYELLRAIQLLEMELQLVKVAKKGKKMFERLEKAKEHCKLAFKIAMRI